MINVKKEVKNSIPPVYFSDYFKINKSKLASLGTFDPIMNFDTALFVEPLLLKKSSSKIIRNATKTYNEYFLNILKLLRSSRKEGDIAWQGAKKLINFPEYQYTCIGYAGSSSYGNGSGKEFNEKILLRAKEMIDISRDEPEILPFLALLEEGIGGDRISDMTQKIIDKEICEYTNQIIKQICFEGKLIKYEVNNYGSQSQVYDLPYNPYSKCVLKLLPEDILSNLPVADSFDGWTMQVAGYNEKLRERINQDLGIQWEKASKREKKESMLIKLKNDKEFFMEIVRALRDSLFDHYDLDKDSEGIYKWLKDSKKFINIDLLKEKSECDDTLEAISFYVELIIKQLRDLIQEQELWRLFWTNIKDKYIHVREFYSQMLFYVVCRTWLKSQNSNINLYRKYNKDTKQIDLRFSISNKFNILVLIKHANNASLENIYKKQLEIYANQYNDKCIFIIINFKEEINNQFNYVRLMKQDYCKIFEIDCTQIIDYIDQLNNTTINFIDEKKDSNWVQKTIPIIEFEDMPKIIDNSNYIKGANKKNKDTNLIKIQIIKQMFKIIRQDSIDRNITYSVANISRKIIKNLNQKSEKTLMQEYNFKDISILKKAIKYNNDKNGGQIESWCYQINNNQL